MDPRPPGPLEQNELVQSIAQSLVPAAPQGWRQLTYLARMIGPLSAQTLAVQEADGQVRHLQVPEGVADRAAELKKACFQQGRGTWISMALSVHHTQRFSVDYDYDTEPELPHEPSPLVYARELERFPREEDLIPDWWRARLQEADLPHHRSTEEDFAAALVQACAREGFSAEYLPPHGLRMSFPGGAGHMDSDLSSTFDQALAMPAEQRPGFAAHFAGFMARTARERGLFAQAGPADPGDTVASALASAFAESGVQVSFQGANTLVVPLPDGNRASADISGFRTALEGADPERAAQEAAAFARASLDQLARAARQQTASADRLRVRLYPAEAFPEGVVETLLAREVAPGLWQAAVIDGPESLQPVRREAHERSGRSEQEVFAQAVAGAVAEPVEVSGHEVNGARIVHVGGPHPYAAAQAHVLDRHLGEAPHGALVAFPVPQVLIAHPLGQGHPIAAMESMQETARRFAADSTTPLSTQLYWWHPGSRSRGPGEPVDLRPVGVEVDHETKNIALRTSDQEFGPLLRSLV